MVDSLQGEISCLSKLARQFGVNAAQVLGFLDSFPAVEWSVGGFFDCPLEELGC